MRNEDRLAEVVVSRVWDQPPRAVRTGVRITLRARSYRTAEEQLFVFVVRRLIAVLGSYPSLIGQREALSTPLKVISSFAESSVLVHYYLRDSSRLLGISDSTAERRLGVKCSPDASAC